MVAFTERANHIYHQIGHARGSRGSVRFTSADGAGGPRTIYGVVSENGAPSEQLRLASYRAPGPRRPAVVRGLRVSRRGRRFRVRVGSSAGAAYLLVRVTASDGRHLLRAVRSRHSLTFPVLGFADHLGVTAIGVSSFGRRGPAARASAREFARVPEGGPAAVPG